MIRRAKAVYGILPPGARNVASSAYGWYLRWWRYGPGTDALVDAAIAREAWTSAQWQRFQEDRLAPLLHRAATRVPHYRDHWRVRRAAGDDASWEDLRNWPVLRKGVLRSSPRSLLADDVSPSRLFRLTTSGTSGTPITLWRSVGTTRAWYALLEARSRKWYGVDRHTPWAILGGQIVTPAERQEPPFWVWNVALRQLYLSALHISERNADAYVHAMHRHGVEHMYGYPSSMYWLADVVRRRGLAPPRLRVIVSNAEPLQPHQRALIGEVFGCPVRDSYGMAEIAAAASECDEGELHLWPDAGILEVMDDDSDTPAAAGASGRLMCTGLLNADMPLIRYEVGDRGALRPQGCGAGACGRHMPQLERIEGRISDNLVSSDGQRSVYIGSLFNDLSVVEAQVVQVSLALVRVNVVAGADFDDDDSSTIAQRLRKRLGPVRVEVDRVQRIPRGPNGKFRSVVNEVSDRGPGSAGGGG